MRSYGACLAALMLVAAPPGLAQEAARGTAAPASAGQLFQAGQFEQAGARYARIVTGDPGDYTAVLNLGRVALLANRLDDAETWFGKAIALRPHAAEPKVMRAAAYYRSYEFEKAAAALEGVDLAHDRLVIAQYPTLDVAQLRSFRGQTPYEVQGAGQSINVKLLRTDPLPLVSVRVNGGAPVTFFIDTGGSEIVLDTAFARELGVPQFGAVTGTFSGGQHAEVKQGRIDALAIGGWTVRNLPVAMMPLRQLSKGLEATRIDGIVGTTFLYHFLATLDYPAGTLILRRKAPASPRQVGAAPDHDGKTTVAVPFWIAGDHFMVGWGQVETLPPTLLFVDTGLTGAGVKLAESVIHRAGITLEEDKAEAGAGGAGNLRIVPYTVRRLSFGEASEQNVPGLYDGPFPWETLFGFHLAGMVGHDFFKRYAVTFDFQNMRIILTRPRRGG
ncbi:retropepsin-like aspartic protease [Acidisphaera rubrifaciens]|uniref:Uncharacterized protein n=1 Tax=Acidisphaera rubrifaciens HS-AP3 TaxID=1231350 RepID=A0A0D6P826_9PROT|nr:retropepsin-like aspartic protease [Acidisphaera rubrifaciens]GAN77925.1 hypothetical protein Asru_0521_05 [Acidisphaera rubrifaciens HS-AP3]